MKPFDEIYSEYADTVFKYLMSLTRSQNLSEELTQETFYKAYKNIDSFEGKSKMSVWLCQIAKNSYFSYIKKEKRINKSVLEDSIVASINIQDTFIQRDNALILHKIIHSLDEPYKEVFNLRLFGELSYQQISEIFCKSESWARVTYCRAKEKIKEEYGRMDRSELKL